MLLQRIFIRYEGKNKYRVYNPETVKISITHSFYIDKQHLYY